MNYTDDENEEYYDENDDMTEEDEEEENNKVHTLIKDEINSSLAAEKVTHSSFSAEPKEKPLDEEKIEQGTNEEQNDLDSLSYKEYIEIIKNRVSKYNNVPDPDRLWKQIKAQIDAGIMLGIKRSKLDYLINSDYSFAQREVIKYLLFVGASEEFIKSINKEMSPEDILFKYDSSKIDKTVVKLIDAPLNTLSNMFTVLRNDTNEIEKKYKYEIDQKNCEITEKNAEIQALNNQIDNILKAAAEEAAKKEEEERIKKLAEAMAKDMLREEERKRDILEEEISVARRKWENEAPVSPGKTKKRLFFGKKDTSEQTKPKLLHSNRELPKDFDISRYMISANLTSSQLDVIALAVKCNVPDYLVKNMIDSKKDAGQLKQYLEVILAKRDAENTKAANDIDQDDIEYVETQ